ncbi:MAG TPA: hypothetical protein P5060_01185 [Candidatus Absconditabacterales bacterium]|nr:hypothetical protein [Candidatus Absconditabacterales bacterium]
MNYELFDNKNQQIFLVDMTREPDYIFSELAKSGLSKYIKSGKKIGILVNKKGYSGGIFCRKCGFVPKCTKCSVSVSYHKTGNSKIGLCHICKSQYDFPQKCPHCGSTEINEFGIGTQQISELLEQEFKTKIQLIESEKANSSKKIKEILKQKDTQIYIGTSLLNTAIQDIDLDLIVFLNADLGLNIPDYSAAKNNFHFLYDTFKNHKCKNFIVQTFNPEYYSIRNACKLDKKGFEKEDNDFRKENNYPPYTDICMIMYKNEIEERLFNKVDKLHKELLYLKEKYQMNDLEIYSTPPIIYKIFGKYRYNIVLKGKDLRNFMDIVYTKLKLTQNNFKINRQAESII